MRIKARSKYGAQATEVDGIRFASKKEAQRYAELLLLIKAGEIHHLHLQPDYDLKVDGVKLGRYVADFCYCTCRRGSKCILSHVVVEDVKGFKTPLYRWKKRHFQAQYGVEIREL